eukprot:scaffold2958_cov177-Chaetoceros_neogracile.AAC.1
MIQKVGMIATVKDYQACCACGGGARGTAPTKTTVSPTVSPSKSITTPPSAPPTEVCTDSPEDWHDSNGTAFNCDWYGNGTDRCSNFGDVYENDGKTANQACCVCGGGRNENDLSSSSPSKILSERPSDPPTKAPSEMPSDPPTKTPSEMPSDPPTKSPSEMPSDPPTKNPSEMPSDPPTKFPSDVPSDPPTKFLSEIPTQVPSEKLTLAPNTKLPTQVPSAIVSSAPSITTSGSNAPAGCADDPLGWYDIVGDNCAWYAEGNRCASYGDSYENFGTTANVACCTCQQDNNNDDDSSSCSDTMEGWYDIDGATYNCAWYSYSNYCEAYGDSYDNFGLTANENCCVCGGGGE